MRLCFWDFDCFVGFASFNLREFGCISLVVLGSSGLMWLFCSLVVSGR